ncbi:MAG: hypothetical protein JO313_10825 [Verrucomicrobia bacterium]|nr:hypothetical protein [Verrucomicrobiota bacterium]
MKDERQFGVIFTCAAEVIDSISGPRIRFSKGNIGSRVRPPILAVKGRFLTSNAAYLHDLLRPFRAEIAPFNVTRDPPSSMETPDLTGALAGDIFGLIGR